MAKYLLIESRDPFESRDCANWLQLAGDLAKDGNEVTLFLVQNAVFAARAGARTSDLAALSKAHVDVLADDFSLRERGITGRLTAGVRAAPLDTVVDLLAAGVRAMWH
jgi:sulfur relay (sulfurtransferase) complex TusBCD TusD component (DsrE family)